MEQWLAHRREDGATQTVLEHLQGTAERARACLVGVGLGTSAYLAGLTHDLGKCTRAFQEYLCEGDRSKRGSVIHTFQGCRLLLELAQNQTGQDPITNVYASELLAFAVGAHHGLFDCIDYTGKSGLQYRKEKTDTFYQEALEGFYSLGISPSEVVSLFAAASAEIDRVLLRIEETYEKDNEYFFEIGLLVRLLLSAVIEGDRHDTAMFMTHRQEPICRGNVQAIWRNRLQFMEEKLARLPRKTAVEKARATISDRCRAFADHPKGIYRLNVPTGSGKTLSSLRYALAHAEKYNQKRLIFTSPLLSILEQNAAVLREFLGDDSLILEHHSNLVQMKQTQESLDERELLIQSWDAPIIITTLVQILNCMFDGKTSSIRRFQALCDSVIVIDEVQSVPTKMLSLFNLTIRFLAEQCGATVLLCSATQPYLEGSDHPLYPVPEDIVPFNPDIWNAFVRTQFHNLAHHRLEQLPHLVRSLMDDTDSLLVVCNKKEEAAFLLEQTKSAEYASYHLSSSMCTQHRRDTVTALKAALGKEKILCISTQVIEAGVDISFQQVLRLTAGMDSIVQSAGRCNRNGECKMPSPVYIVNCSDENLGKLPDIQRGKTATVSLLHAFQQDRHRFHNDLTSDEAIRYYYKAFYSDMGAEAQDYPQPNLRTTILDLISENHAFTAYCPPELENCALRQAFKTAGQAFSVFDENSIDVLVPYGEGCHLISKLCTCSMDLDACKAILKQAAGYSVNIFDYQRDRLDAVGALYSICDGTALVLRPEYYDKLVGLRLDASNLSFLEV